MQAVKQLELNDAAGGSHLELQRGGAGRSADSLRTSLWPPAPGSSPAASAAAAAQWSFLGSYGHPQPRRPRSLLERAVARRAAQHRSCVFTSWRWFPQGACSSGASTRAWWWKADARQRSLPAPSPLYRSYARRGRRQGHCRRPWTPPGAEPSPKPRDCAARRSGLPAPTPTGSKRSQRLRKRSALAALCGLPPTPAATTAANRVCN